MDSLSSAIITDLSHVKAADMRAEGIETWLIFPYILHGIDCGIFFTNLAFRLFHFVNSFINIIYHYNTMSIGSIDLCPATFHGLERV